MSSNLDATRVNCKVWCYDASLIPNPQNHQTPRSPCQESGRDRDGDHGKQGEPLHSPNPSKETPAQRPHPSKHPPRTFSKCMCLAPAVLCGAPPTIWRHWHVRGRRCPTKSRWWGAMTSPRNHACHRLRDDHDQTEALKRTSAAPSSHAANLSIAIQSS